jgi:hypothetical protein
MQTFKFDAFNWRGEKKTIYVRGQRILAACQGVTLILESMNSYAVVYGLQVKDKLSYCDAGREFGLNVMHSLACDSAIRAPKEDA